MASIDFKDFYIKYQGHPKYNSNVIIEQDIINVVIQKYELLLFTNKGEVLGEPDFGADLEKYLFQTRVSATFVEDEINRQIVRYIPELIEMNYRLEVAFVKDIESYQEAMFVYFTLADYEVFAKIGSRYNTSF